MSKGAKDFPHEKFPMRKLVSEEEKRARYTKSSESMKKAWQNPEIRNRITNGLEKARSSPEYHKNLSIAIKRGCANETARKNKSNAMKKRYENPEYCDFIKTHLSKVNRNRCRKIRCVETGIIYSSIKEAGELSECTYAMIKHCLSNTVKNPKFHWVYLD